MRGLNNAKLLWDVRRLPYTCRPQWICFPQSRLRIAELLLVRSYNHASTSEVPCIAGCTSETVGADFSSCFH